MNSKISIVTPMYNESDMVAEYFVAMEAIVGQLEASGVEVELVAVNDGSRDDTWDKLALEAERRKGLVLVNLSRNFGQEAAVFAGLEHASGDAIVVMDCDLQDPPELIVKMVEIWQQGYDVVNAKRSDRKVDSFFQRTTAAFYYSVLNNLSYKVEYPENVNNFRLISRRVRDVVLAYPSNQKLFRNAVAQAGFSSAEIEFARRPRAKGESKVNPKSMIRLSLMGIADSSVAPLSISFTFALVFLICSGIALIGALVLLILADCGVKGIMFLVGAHLFFPLVVFFMMMLFCGIVLMFVAINAFYIGKIHLQLQNRPMYTIDKVIKS